MCPLKNINIKNFRSFMIIYSTRLHIMKFLRLQLISKKTIYWKREENTFVKAKAEKEER